MSLSDQVFYKGAELLKEPWPVKVPYIFGSIVIFLAWGAQFAVLSLEYQWMGGGPLFQAFELMLMWAFVGSILLPASWSFYGAGLEFLTAAFAGQGWLHRIYLTGMWLLAFCLLVWQGIRFFEASAQAEELAGVLQPFATGVLQWFVLTGVLTNAMGVLMGMATGLIREVRAD